jgi:hypothetical protein
MAEELDPKISRRYRELGDEEPPRELDQAILAAAHRAADRAHAPLVAPAGRHRWYFAFGAAAILVLAVAITVQVERQQLDPEALPAASAPAVSERKEGFSSEPGVLADQAPAQEARRKPAQAPAPAKPQPAENTAKPQAAEVARADRLEARQQQAPAVEPQNTQAPASSAAATPTQPEKREQSAAAEAAPSRRASPQSAQPGTQGILSSEERRAPAPAAAPTPAPQVLASAVALPPERLLERIAELRKEGRHEEADKALAEFRQLYPDYRISEEMLKKVERPR